MTKRLSAVLIAAASMLCATNGPTIPAVPEPSTYLMMAAGLGGLVYIRHRYEKNKK